jgi:diguanylate cyclase (GGDEF)-like protein
MDLDHFKSVNDLHGHAVGDRVLCRFVDAVRGCVRSFDLIVRRGGEEFELVMPNTGPVEGYRVAERIRAKLASEPLVVRDDLAVHQTVSIGLATWDGHESAEALDQRADQAMYEAKRRGRNRTVTASQPPAPTTENSDSATV